MAAFLDYDPTTGVEQWVDGDDNNRLQVHYRQDVEPVLEYAKALRNDGLTDSGIKRDWWHYAIIPPVVILEMKHKYGVDVFDANHRKRVMELINTEYQFCKTTDKRHTVRN